MNNGKYLLQDSRSYVGSNLQFWKAGGGYTTDINQAEQFSWDAAMRQNQTRDTDIPWPVQYIADRSHQAVDCQYLKASDADAFATPGADFVNQVLSTWDGNDVFWLYADGTSRGPIFGKALAGPPRPGFVAWPKAYIMTKTRWVVHQTKVSIRRALPGIKLPKPKHQRQTPCRCEQCGRFISNDNRFLPCPSCGADNRP